MNAGRVFLGVLLGLGGAALVLAAGVGVLAGDFAALPVLVLGGVVAVVGVVLARSGLRGPARRTVRTSRGHSSGYYLPGPAADAGAAYHHNERDHDSDRNHGGGWSGGDSGGGWSSGGGDSGGGWSSGGGDSGGGWSSGGGDSGGGGGS